MRYVISAHHNKLLYYYLRPRDNDPCTHINTQRNRRLECGFNIWLRRCHASPRRERKGPGKPRGTASSQPVVAVQRQYEDNNSKQCRKRRAQGSESPSLPQTRERGARKAPVAQSPHSRGTHNNPHTVFDYLAATHMGAWAAHDRDGSRHARTHCLQGHNAGMGKAQSHRIAPDGN